MRILVIPGNVTRIGQNALIGCQKSIILPKSIKDISNGAFESVYGLEEVYFTSSEVPNISHASFAENVILYVSPSSINKYKEKACFKSYGDRVKTKEINIHSVVDGKNVTVPFKYGQALTDISSLKKEGHRFIGFEGSNGKTYKIGDVLYYTEDVTLTPLYEKVYTFTLSDLGQNIELKYGEEVQIEYQEREGYIYKGYVNKDGILVIDANGKIVWTNIDVNNKLTPKYEAIVYTIEYELNGATAFTNLPTEFTHDKLIFFDELLVKKFGYEFVGWYEADKPNDDIFNTSTFYRNIRLIAKFNGTYVDISKREISKEVAIIDLSKENLLNRLFKSYDFVIMPSCKYVSFIGGENSFKGTITIKSRSDDITIGLKNIKFESGNSTGIGKNTIESSSNCQVIIAFYGAVTIVGGLGATGSVGSSYSDPAAVDTAGSKGRTGGNGSKGGSGISCKSIEFQAFTSDSKMEVYGGKGGTGGAGGKGQTGGTGKEGPRGWFWSPIKGDSGKNGGQGGTGGKGGDGGYALDATTVKISSAANITFVGGAGGAGGKGGKGGIGGVGTSDTSANIFNGVGDPGDGGTGGFGGTGGAGGNGSSPSNLTMVKGDGGAAGQGGAAGTAGDGGEGGNAGANGNNGNQGKQGEAGSSGTNGRKGKDGASQSGSSSRFVSLNDPFSRKYRTRIYNLSKIKYLNTSDQHFLTRLLQRELLNKDFEMVVK